MKIGIDGVKCKDINFLGFVVQGEKHIEREPTGRVVLVIDVPGKVMQHG